MFQGNISLLCRSYKRWQSILSGRLGFARVYLFLVSVNSFIKWHERERLRFLPLHALVGHIEWQIGVGGKVGGLGGGEHVGH